MNITLNVDNDMLFPIGTHLWVPVPKGWKTFNEICPVCDHPQSYFQVLAENY